MLGERFNAGAPRDVVVVVPQKDHEGTHRGRGRKGDTIRKKGNDTWKQRMREREIETGRASARGASATRGPPTLPVKRKVMTVVMISIVFLQNDAHAHKISKIQGFLVFFLFYFRTQGIP